MKYPKSAPRLCFHKPVFNHGLNVTVRLGAKWALAFHAEGHEEIVLLDGVGEPITAAQIVGVHLLPLCAVTQNSIIFDQNPDCRTLAGLREYLSEAYQQDVSGLDYVSVIYFNV